MISLLIYSAIFFCIGIIIFLLIPFFHILFKKFKYFDQVKKYVLQGLSHILLASVLTILISIGFLIIKNIKERNKEKEITIENIINIINDKQYKVYRIYCPINDMEFERSFRNEKDSLKNIIIIPNRISNTIFYYITKNEINDISNIELNNVIKINALLVKKINNKELNELLKSSENRVNIEKIIKDLQNE